MMNDEEWDLGAAAGVLIGVLLGIIAGTGIVFLLLMTLEALR